VGSVYWGRDEPLLQDQRVIRGRDLHTSGRRPGRRARLFRIGVAGVAWCAPLCQAVAQAGSPPAGPALFTLDFGQLVGDFPKGVKPLTGSLEVVEKDGVRMLRAAAPSEFLVALPDVLPPAFTIEFGLIPKQCCNPEDLGFEGTATMNRGTASAQVLWSRERLAVIGGGEMYQGAMPAALAGTLPGQLSTVVVTFDSTEVKLYTNGQRLFTLADRRFMRGRVLRVFLGGQDEGDQAVYLAGLRITAGAAPPVFAAATPASAPTPPTIQSPPPSQPTPQLPPPTVVPRPPGQADSMLRQPPPTTAVRRISTGEPPTGLAASGAVPLVTLSWKPAAGATSYRVFRTLPGTTNWQELSATPIQPPAGAPADSPLTPDPFLVSNDTQLYTYRVVALQPDGRAGEATVDYALAPPLGQGTTLTQDRTQPLPRPVTTTLLVGTGISDITGPLAEVGMMGYADGNQKTGGLHTRLYARAFIFGNPTTGKRVVFVSTELGMLFSSVKQGVLKKLKALYGARYDDRNVMLSATHTHAGPGGFSHHVLFNITTSGHVAQNYAAIVDGITEAIVQADSGLATGSVSVMTGEVAEQTMVNRSVVAFVLNPEARAARVSLDGRNRGMSVLRIERGGRPIGAIAWHAVHNTSMTKYNVLVSSDHKGYAAYLFEKQYGSIAPMVNYGSFVAAFPNGAEGDLSPNLNTSDPEHFTGPGSDEFQSSAIIGQREFDTAHSLFINAGQLRLTGEVDFRQKFLLMPGLVVTSTPYVNGAGGKVLCSGAYGFSFMAGAEDGPAGPLKEGWVVPNAAAFATLSAVRQTAVVIVAPLIASLVPMALPLIEDFMMKSDDPCQIPKPILIPSGALAWSPQTLPFQLLRVGQVAIAGIPGEMTTQAGRRLRDSLAVILAPIGVTQVILTGLANEYSGYITTPEEYDSQQYEGASTVFGRLTFEAYQQAFRELAMAMVTGREMVGANSPPPLDLGLLPQVQQQGIVAGDGRPADQEFGQVLMQPYSTVSRGSAIPVQVTFRSGNPNNDLRRNSTHFWIERDAGGGNWVLEAWDSTPDTKLFWGRSIGSDPRMNCPDPERCDWSQVNIFWNVPATATPGTYRIRYSGSWKNGVTGALAPYSGVTMAFVVQ